MRSFSKFLCIFLSLIILCGTLSAGIYATADSEDTGRYSDSSIGTPIEPTRDAHLHFYFANAEDGDLLSYNWSNLCETRYASGNGNSHYYQQWELYYYTSGNYNVVLPFGGDRPYALSVNPSTNVVSIESINISDPCQHWIRVIKPNGTIALVSKATGTSANGKALYINGSSFTVSNTNYTAFCDLNYDYWQPASYLIYNPVYVAPGQTKAILPSYPLGDSVHNALVKLEAPGSNIFTIDAHKITGVTPGQTNLKISDKVTDAYVNVTATVTEIPNGVYFMKNRQYPKFAKVKNENVSDRQNVVQYEFGGSDCERWQFTLDTWSGYYSIKSTGSSSSYYLTVEDNASTLGKDIVLGTTSLVNGAKWRVSRSTSGAYILTPKTGENAGGSGVYYVLAVNSNNSENLVQDRYYNDSNYRDEWILFGRQDCSLTATCDSDTRSDAFCYIENALLNNGIGSVFNSYNQQLSLDKCEIEALMCNSEIMLEVSHGCRTYITARDSNISIEDIQNLSDDAFENTKLVLLGSCMTAEGGYNAENFAHELSNAGVMTVIGFENRINQEVFDIWARNFFKKYIDSFYDPSIRMWNEVCLYADCVAMSHGDYWYYTYEGDLVTTANYVIFGNEDIDN